MTPASATSLTSPRHKWSERSMIGKTSCLTISCLLLACGASKSGPAVPDAENSAASASVDKAEAAPEAEEEKDEPTGPMSIPTECHGGSDPCTANPKWVKRLCSDVYPGVALFLFQARSPFARGYVSARQVRAVNASGGVTSGEEWLQFDEEVVLLYHRKAQAGGIQVSGSGDSYEAMRLDGSCVSLGDDEVRTDVPPKPKHVQVPWRYIGDDMQEALRTLPGVKEAYIERRSECKGAFSGSVTDKCIKKDAALNTAIVAALKDAKTDLPQPEKRP
jgi:hypothetical protein